MSLLMVVAVLALVVGGSIALFGELASTTGAGMASTRDIRKSMSTAAMRQSAAVTRKSISEPKKVPPTDLGVTLGQEAGRFHQRLYSPWNAAVLVIAPPQTAKTAWLSGPVIDAPGACVTTSTKPDVYHHTVALRAKRGPIFVLDPADLTGTDSTFRWSPIAGCTSPAMASRRAQDLIAGANSSAGNDDRHFWESNAAKVLGPYLFAAAVGGRSMDEVMKWVNTERDQTPLRIMEGYGKTPPQFLHDVRSVYQSPDRTRGSIFTTLQTALSFMTDEDVARIVEATDDRKAFDAEDFVRRNGTLYLLAEEQPHGSISPLFAALTSHIFRTAKKMAARAPNQRLDPPLVMALDEAALICKVPLERWTSDSGGRGITLLIAVQSRSQLDDKWGEKAGATIWSNCVNKLIFGGLTDPHFLEALSKLCGMREERHHTRSRNGEHHSVSTTTRTVPVMSVDDLRRLREFTALLLHRNSKPVLTRITPVWERPDVKAIARPTRPPKPKRRPTPPPRPEKLGEVVPITSRKSRKRAAGE